MGEVGSAAGPVLGVLELLDRDGQWRVAHVVHDWPLRIGRALDGNDVLLADPHVAPHHLSIAPADDGLGLQVLDTDNGVDHGPKRLRRGERETLRGDGEAPEFVEFSMNGMRWRTDLLHGQKTGVFLDQREN